MLVKKVTKHWTHYCLSFGCSITMFLLQWLRLSLEKLPNLPKDTTVEWQSSVIGLRSDVGFQALSPSNLCPFSHSTLRSFHPTSIFPILLNSFSSPNVNFPESLLEV